MKDENKTQVELIKELRFLREELKKGVFKNFIKHKLLVEQDLNESEEKYRNLIESANESIILVDLQGNLLTLNSRAVSYLGRLAENYTGKTLWDIFPQKVAEERFAELQKAIQLGEPIIKESYIPFQGKMLCFLYSMQPIRNRAGDIYSVLILASDITERKQAESALVESEEKYRTIFENAGTATIIVEEDTVISLANSGFERLSGYSKEEIENKMKWTDFVVPEDLKMMAEYHTARRKVGEKPPTEYEFRFIDKKGVIKNIFLKVGIIPGTKKSVASLMDITEHKQAEEKLKKIRDAALDTMSRIIEAKDPYTSGHQHRVCQLSISIAQEMTLPEDQIEGIRIASLIHDIGKISLPTEILSKPTKLTDIEFSLIKEHSQVGYDILKSNDFSHPVANIVLQHHERLNGSGYPQGLKGEYILLEAKIIGVADVVEAMSSHRPYRPALGIDKALEEISKNKGILYDPELVDTCLRIFKEKGFKFE